MVRLLVLLTLSFSAVAGTPPPYAVCPALTKEATSILNSIQSLKNQVKSGVINAAPQDGACEATDLSPTVTPALP